MRGWKKVLAAVLLLIMIGSCGAGFYWSLQNNVLVDFKLYPKSLETLDLRGQTVSIRKYEQFRKKLPDTEIYWNIPFQDNYYDQGNKNLTVSTLSKSDIEDLDYFTKLETVDALQCRDYENLQALQQRRPEVKVNYRVEIGGETYSPKATSVVLTSVTQEEIQLLQYLPQLKTVAVGGSGDVANFADLQVYCREHGYDFCVQIGETSVSLTDTELTVDRAGEEELSLLQFLPNVKSLHLKNPEAPVEALISLQQRHPNMEITWSSMVAGKTFQSNETLIDISNITVGDLSQVEAEMEYFPNATQLEMHLCGVENEEMAAFREAHREDYKVVWTVELGPKYSVRTDIDNIKPAHDATSDFHDADAYNMRYCEDVIAIDIGHLDVRNVEFAAFMPHLKYLVVSWTGVKDLTPLANCKELVFFEGTDAPIGDLTPLKECTALEDINVSASGAKNSDALVDLPNLKHFWVIQRGDLGWPITSNRPDVTVRASGSHTVSGWRSIPNYYAMRDALGMFYMNG